LEIREGLTHGKRKKGQSGPAIEKKKKTSKCILSSGPIGRKGKTIGKGRDCDRGWPGGKEKKEEVAWGGVNEGGGGRSVAGSPMTGRGVSGRKKRKRGDRYQHNKEEGGEGSAPLVIRKRSAHPAHRDVSAINKVATDGKGGEKTGKRPSIEGEGKDSLPSRCDQKKRRARPAFTAEASRGKVPSKRQKDGNCRERGNKRGWRFWKWGKKGGDGLPKIGTLRRRKSGARKPAYGHKRRDAGKERSNKMKKKREVEVRFYRRRECIPFWGKNLKGRGGGAQRGGRKWTKMRTWKRGEGAVSSISRGKRRPSIFICRGGGGGGGVRLEKRRGGERGEEGKQIRPRKKERKEGTDRHIS